ncbi:MAG: lysophospholipase [Candidatus Omnitrophota bacterium]|jgi:alpha-beta hydrolase superfamily lysophospholipase
MSPNNSSADSTHEIVSPLTGWIQDHFKSRDGTRIFYRFYPAPGARHTVIMLHGYGEHSGRYEKFPGKMGCLSAQFAVMDFRGMGRSEGIRGHVGFFDDYLGDVTAFVEHLRKSHSIPQKFILFGHSLGGLVGVLWAMKNPEPVKLLILSAPFLGLRFSRIIRPLNCLIRVFAPGFIYRNPVRSRTLSHDPAEIAIHRKDPLILRHISTRLVGEIARCTETLRKQHILSVPFPVHMLVPGKERIVAPAASRRFFDRLVSPCKERTFFNGFFHEIFNEQDQQKAFNVLKTIIEDCV